jgi:hypothetical protein
MTSLSNTQLVSLGAAAQRADLAVLPLPDTHKLKGSALTKVMDNLRNRGLIRVIGADGGPQRVVITSEGMAAIGVEHDEGQTPAPAEVATPPTSADANAPAAEVQAPINGVTARPRRANAGASRRRKPPGPRRAASGAHPLHQLDGHRRADREPACGVADRAAALDRPHDPPSQVHGNRSRHDQLSPGLNHIVESQASILCNRNML